MEREFPKGIVFSRQLLLNETTSGHMLKFTCSYCFYIKAMLRRLKHVIITIFFAESIPSVTLSLSIVLRKILCRPRKDASLSFSRYVQGTQGKRDEAGCKGSGD